MNGVDAKHRLSVPAPLRETIETRSQVKALVLGPDEHMPCLVGYDVSYFERIQARLDNEFAGDFGPSRGAKARELFGMTEQLKYDDTGRILLGPMLRDLGELTGPAVFMGMGDHFQIWAPALLLKHHADNPRLARMVNALLAGKAA